MAEITAQEQYHTTKVEKRTDSDKKSVRTSIWQEVAAPGNPYLANSCRCYGYDLLELMGKCRYCEVLYLLFNGDLPTTEQAELFEQLQIAIVNPGIRHPAVQASMTAATSKCDATNILPIGLSVLGGQHLGGAEVEQSMQFMKKSYGNPIEKVITQQIISAAESNDLKGDIHPLPGFGSRFGGIDPMACAIAEQLCQLAGAGKYLQWGTTLVNELMPYSISWLMPGVVAATLLDLDFHPRMGSGIYQLLSAPGLLAHASEYDARPFNSLPFPDDEHYYIEASDELI